MTTDKNQLRTVPLTSLGVFDLEHQRRVSLLIYHRDGLEAVQLAGGQAVVVGRATPAQVCVPHASLSRQHARFELIDGEVWVEDLGSTNGTLVDGEPVERVRVEAGRDVTLGEVTVTVHAIAPTEGHLPGLSGHERFVAALEEEVVRHRTFERGLGLLLVQTEDRKRGQLGRWVGRVRGLLRPVDRLALYSLTAVELLLPEVDQAGLRKLGEAVVHGRERGEPELRCGAALFPHAATSAEELLEAARTAVVRADSATPVQVVSGGDRPSAPAAGGTVTAGPAMQKVYDTVARVARTPLSVLIVGETGSGKEVVAQAIHDQSPRADRPLRCINCAAIPNQLIESILFGHEKGAFTGADRRSNGIFREADGGTVLLDEIGELSAEAQSSLLRALETKKVLRVGSTSEDQVDVRVLAATHRNLEAMCEAGGFRWDLFYRINTMTLQIPPLRERPEEVAPLCELFLRQANEASGFDVAGIEPAALALLRRFAWPGNVRELRNVIHRAVVMAAGERIAIADLPERVCAGGAAASADPEGSAPAVPLDGLVEASLAHDELDYKDRIQRIEQGLIERALADAGGNQTEAAQRLRIPVRTLSYKIRSFGITVPR